MLVVLSCVLCGVLVVVPGVLSVGVGEGGVDAELDEEDGDFGQVEGDDDVEEVLAAQVGLQRKEARVKLIAGYIAGQSLVKTSLLYSSVELKSVKNESNELTMLRSAPNWTKKLISSGMSTSTKASRSAASASRQLNMAVLP